MQSIATLQVSTKKGKQTPLFPTGRNPSEQLYTVSKSHRLFWGGLLLNFILNLFDNPVSYTRKRNKGTMDTFNAMQHFVTPTELKQSALKEPLNMDKML